MAITSGLHIQKDKAERLYKDKERQKRIESDIRSDIRWGLKDPE